MFRAQCQETTRTSFGFWVPEWQETHQTSPEQGWETHSDQPQPRKLQWSADTKTKPTKTD